MLLLSTGGINKKTPSRERAEKTEEVIAVRHGTSGVSSALFRDSPYLEKNQTCRTLQENILIIVDEKSIIIVKIMCAAESIYL